MMERVSNKLPHDEEAGTYKEEKLHFVQPFKQTKSRWIWLQSLNKELKWLWKQKEAQKLFTLIGINLIGTVILLIWCRLTSSLALLSYSYLSWFNFLSLLTWLLCIWVDGQTASYTFTFGLVRCEVLAVFTSVTLTLLGSIFIIKESIERLIMPEEINVEHISCMALIGFILNVIMTTLIQNPPLTHVLRCSPTSVLQEHFTDICQGLCFQIPCLKQFMPLRLNPLILIYLVGFLLNVANHIFVQVYNYTGCDTLVGFLVAVSTISTMYPLCIYSANLLLQTIPLHYSAHLDKCLREASTIDGVLEFRNEKFWILGVGQRGARKERFHFGNLPGPCIGSVVSGSLHVRVRRDANEQMVLKHVRERLEPLVPILTVQVFKDDWLRNSTIPAVNNSHVFPQFGEADEFSAPAGSKSVHGTKESVFSNHLQGCSHETRKDSSCRSHQIDSYNSLRSPTSLDINYIRDGYR